jgi:ATP synthase protein I
MTKGGSVPSTPDSGDPAGSGPGRRDPARQLGGNRFRWSNAGSAGKPVSAGDAAQPASAGRGGRPASAGSGYTYLSYMLGGMALYGLIGWLIGRWTHQAYLLPVGMIVGLALSVVLIIYRVTRSGPGT